jgi:hypothetical protein
VEPPSTNEPVTPPPITEPPNDVASDGQTNPPEVSPDAAKNDTKITPLKADEIVVPNGLEVDAKLRDGFTEWVNKYGIPRDAALELAKMQIEQQKAAGLEQRTKWDEVQEVWTKETKADPVIGGEKLEAALGAVSKLIDRFGDSGGAELRKVFDLTGAGNHLQVVKFLYNIAKELGEGGAIFGKPATTPVDPAHKLYPNMA